MNPENPYLEMDQKIVGDIHTSPVMWDNISKLCDEYGSRFGGTAGEKLAAEFLRDQLKSYGLQNVAMEPFEYLGWRRGEATLEVTSPIQMTIPCISLPHCPPGEVEAVVLDLDEAAPADFEARAAEIEGKIVLVNSVVSPKGSKRWIHRNEKLGRSIMAGAAGFLFVNHYPAYGAVTGGIGHRGQAALIPGFGLSYEDGTFLQRLVKQHGQVQIKLTSRDTLEQMTSWNVVGELPGTGDEIVMFGSHYDGHDISQGAEDPISGTVAALEAARVLAAYHPGKFKATIRIALWGVEEIGLLGSKEYVQVHQDEIEKIRFYFNMDSAGAVKDKGVVLNEWPELAPIFEAWSQEMNFPFDVGQSISAHSDHFPFLLAGAPTGGMEQVKKTLSGRGYGHTAYDTLDKISLASLRDAATLAARLLLRIANAENWPAAHRKPSEVSALFQGPQYQEEATYDRAIAKYYLQHGKGS